MQKENKRILVYTLLIIAFLVAMGFVGYYFGFLGTIYNVMMPQTFSKFNIITLSIIFGIAAFFSPCAFTVLPAYVSNYLMKQEKQKSKFTLLKLGLFAALGIIIVNITIGLIIAILGEATPFSKDPRTDIPIILAVRVIAGLVIAFLGFMTLVHKSVNIGFIQNFLAKKNISKSMFGYGIIYNAAAIGCTGPIMLGLVLYAYASGSFISALISFIVFSLTMGMLIVIITVLMGLFKSIIVKRMLQVTPVIMKTAGIIMIIVGLSIAILTLEGNKIFVNIFFPFLE